MRVVCFGGFLFAAKSAHGGGAGRARVYAKTSVFGVFVLTIMAVMTSVLWWKCVEQGLICGAIIRG